MCFKTIFVARYNLKKDFTLSSSFNGVHKIFRRIQPVQDRYVFDRKQNCLYYIYKLILIGWFYHGLNSEQKIRRSTGVRVISKQLYLRDKCYVGVR